MIWKEMPEMLRKIMFSIMIVLVLLAMVACSTTNILPTPEEVPPQVEEETGENDNSVSQPISPGKGGELRIPLTMPKEIHPLLSTSKDYINLSGLVYEGLFSFGENLELVPSLVESWEISDEGKLWQFQLREGVRWHDGREFTAQDVKYTFNLLFNEIEKEEGVSLYAQRLFNGRSIARVELVLNNPHGVAIILNEPAGIAFLEALTFPILPAEGLGQLPTMENVNSLIGTGPYRVESGIMEIGEQIKLGRNPRWWGTPEPYIDSIIANVYEDRVESLEAFRQGKVDLVNTHVIHAESYSRTDNPQLYRYLTQNLNYIGINHKSSGNLGDKRIREAIAYGIDRKDIISRVYAGNAQAVDVPLPPDAWYYDSDLRVYDYQPLKAQQLLTSAGWTDLNEDGILYKDYEGEGTELSFTINVNMDSIMDKEALNLIAEQLGDLGIAMELRLLPWEEYIMALEEGDFEAVFMECYPDISTDLRPLFHSQEIGIGTNNFIQYEDEELDQYLDQIMQIDDPEEFLETYKRIQEHLIDELPIISLYYRTSSLMTSEKVHGVRIPRELMVFRDINKWHLAP